MSEEGIPDYTGIALTEETCPILRDSGDLYKPLEKLFGCLTAGMAFGESPILNLSDNKNRFYNAIALTECYVLHIRRDDYERVYQAQERRSLSEKMAFIKTIPEFNSQTLTRSKLQYLCQNLFPISRIKGNVLYSEGDLAKHVYFIRKGEVQIQKKVLLRHANDNSAENVAELLEDPTIGRKKPKNSDTNSETKQHVVGVVSKGHILGIEDVILGKTEFYQTSAIVHSQEDGVELYRIERDMFCNPLK